LIYLVVVSVVWAFSFPLIKLRLTGLDASFVALVRMTLALLVLLPFLPFATSPQSLAVIGTPDR